jgi:biotin transport system substrate-specific component
MDNYSLIGRALLANSVIAKHKVLSFSLTVITGVAFLAALSQISIPFPGSPVPITGQTLGVLLIGSGFGIAAASTTFLTYLIAGISGLPFFANGTSGWARIAGPTGGYLVGMLFATFLLSYLSKNNFGKNLRTALPSLLISEILIFAFGVFWLEKYTKLSFGWAITHGLTPFLLGEFIKVGLTASTATYLWRKR